MRKLNNNEKKQVVKELRDVINKLNELSKAGRYEETPPLTMKMIRLRMLIWENSEGGILFIEGPMDE